MTGINLDHSSRREKWSNSCSMFAESIQLHVFQRVLVDDCMDRKSGAHLKRRFLGYRLYGQIATD